jgi:hypothetical protein
VARERFASRVGVVAKVDLQAILAAIRVAIGG